ncbi:Phosphoglucosamine mutase [Dissostichus eleginoides]|uniref:Phosphoglucosamine mutase n=1 Tax=Dissostichus eleginoides TaxID=100907 RepID=A0AAD9B2D8_DISEL|nr:Phosphoglucosamine mutase [Dissostichus eleginoides]
MVRVARDHFRDSFKEKEVGRGDDFLGMLDRQVPGDIVQALEVPLRVSELEGSPLEPEPWSRGELSPGEGWPGNGSPGDGPREGSEWVSGWVRVTLLVPFITDPP